MNSIYARGWDTAGGIPDPAKGYRPDWTVGVKVAKCPDGNYYICGMDRFQERAGPRDNRILKLGSRDGVDCDIVMAQDAGSAGKFQYQEFAKKTVTEGLRCRPDPMPPNKSKLTRYEPFSIAANNGLVHIVESSFSSEDLESFYRENELFTGERSTTKLHDDIPDALASTFNYLAGTRNIRIVPRNQQHNQTIAAGMLQSNNVSIKDINKPDDTNYRSI